MTININFNVQGNYKGKLGQHERAVLSFEVELIMRLNPKWKLIINRIVVTLFLPFTIFFAWFVYNCHKESKTERFSSSKDAWKLDFKKRIEGVVEKILFYEINHTSDLKYYQKIDTKSALRVIYKHFCNPKKILILDVGCNTSEAKYLAGHVKRVVGINLDRNYLGGNACLKNLESNVMDGTRLGFSDKTFDFVYSFNLYEHINNLSKCIDEQLRVLKDGGFCYARWKPIWSGPRGHHVHDNMVRLWENYLKIKTTVYKNDGQFIKDWSHLLLSKEEMFDSLMPMLKTAKLVNMIVEFIYLSDNINRIFFDEIMDLISKKNLLVVFLEKTTDEIPLDMLNNLKNKYNYSDFTTSKCELLFRKL